MLVITYGVIILFSLKNTKWIIFLNKTINVCLGVITDSGFIPY